MRHEVWDGSTIIEAHEVDAMLEKASNSEYELSTIREPEIEGMFADKVPGAEHFRSSVGWFVTNVGSLTFVLRAIAEKLLAGDGKVVAGAMTIRGMRRAILRSLKREGRSKPELTKLLYEVEKIAAAHRVVTEGTMLMGWEGEAIGAPKHAIMAALPRGKKPAAQLGREEIEQLAANTANCESALKWDPGRCPGKLLIRQAVSGRQVGPDRRRSGPT